MHRAASMTGVTVGCFFCIFVMALDTADVENVIFPPAFLRDLTGQWAPCQGVKEDCVCQGTAAKCSDDFGLTSIPKFTENITTLLLYVNQSRGADFQDNFFQNVSDIVELYVTGSFLFDDHAVALGFLQRLRVLCFESVSQMLYPHFDHLQYIPSVQEVYFSGIYLTALEEWFVFEPVEFELTTLYIGNSPDSRKPQMISLATLRPFRRLRYIVIENYPITPIYFYLGKAVILASITQITFRNTELKTFPNTCLQNEKQSYLPQLSCLILDNNKIEEIPHRPCLRNLTYLRLQHNHLSIITEDEFSQERFPKLKHLSLKRAGFISRIPSRALSNPSLESLDLSYLSYTAFDFASNGADEGFFDNCTKLTSLNLEGNDFQRVNSFKMNRMLANMTELRVLNLANTRFPPINKTTFKFLKFASEINLANNKLSDIPDGAFDNIDLLSKLRLDKNAITTVGEKTFSTQLRRRLQSLNLSHNPFHCACSLLWFRQWLLSNPGLFDLHNPYTRYDCHNLQGTAVAEWTVHRQQCLLSHEAYVATVVCTTLLICTLSVAILIYRYRWHIRLALYEVFRGDLQAGWKNRRPEDFMYDLFICYDSENVHWVLQELMPSLEEGSGLRLCVHQRDFIPGKNITDNILDCLQASKRVLAIFSPSFAESQWCNFELELCLSHVIDNHDVMVLVMLEHVPSRDMSGAMLALLKTTTYIEWGEEADARELFWRRLTLSLTDVLPATRQRNEPR